MVGPELEGPVLNLEPKVLDSTKSSQQLLGESAVGDLGAVQLFGEEPQWLPRAAWVVLLV